MALFGLVLVGLLSLPSSADARCGKERWSVKTGTDSDAQQVDMTTQNTTTIDDMRSWEAPDHPPSKRRIAPHELEVYVIEATLIAYKEENDPHTGDSDYHLVLADESGDTIIAEIPSPTCVGEQSPFFDSVKDVRAKFDEKFGVTGDFQDTSMPVKVTGVGFFDFKHGQRGLAPNAIELHPVATVYVRGLWLHATRPAVLVRRTARDRPCATAS
jgi:hypothetical protein